MAEGNSSMQGAEEEAAWQGSLNVRDMYYIKCMAFSHDTGTHTQLKNILGSSILDSSGKLSSIELWRFINEIPNKVMLLRLVPKREYTQIYNALYHYLYKQGTCLLLSKINMDVREICIIPDGIPDNVTGIRQELKVKECKTLLGVVVLKNECEELDSNLPQMHYHSHQLIPTLKVEFAKSNENKTMSTQMGTQQMIEQQDQTEQGCTQDEVTKQSRTQQKVNQHESLQQKVKQRGRTQQSSTKQDRAKPKSTQQERTKQMRKQQDRAKQNGILPTIHQQSPKEKSAGCIQCTHCSKEFKYHSSRRNHEQSHLTVKTYKCPVCYKHFVNRYNLQRHQKVHNIKREIESHWICKICKMTFVEKQSLNNHITYKHANRKIFECSKCFRKYKYSFSKNRHEKKCTVST